MREVTFPYQYDHLDTSFVIAKRISCKTKSIQNAVLCTNNLNTDINIFNFKENFIFTPKLVKDLLEEELDKTR